MSASPALASGRHPEFNPVAAEKQLPRRARRAAAAAWLSLASSAIDARAGRDYLGYSGFSMSDDGELILAFDGFSVYVELGREPRMKRVRGKLPRVLSARGVALGEPLPLPDPGGPPVVSTTPRLIPRFDDEPGAALRTELFWAGRLRPDARFACSFVGVSGTTIETVDLWGAMAESQREAIVMAEVAPEAVDGSGGPAEVECDA